MPGAWGVEGAGCRPCEPRARGRSGARRPRPGAPSSCVSTLPDVDADTAPGDRRLRVGLCQDLLVCQRSHARGDAHYYSMLTKALVVEKTFDLGGVETHHRHLTAGRDGTAAHQLRHGPVARTGSLLAHRPPALPVRREGVGEDTKRIVSGQLLARGAQRDRASASSGSWSSRTRKVSKRETPALTTFASKDRASMGRGAPSGLHAWLRMSPGWSIPSPFCPR